MKSILHLIVRTSGDWAPLIARLTLALVFFPHGAQKVLGWFGGYGFTGTMGYFTSTAHLPYAVALLPVLTEFLAPFALAAGFATRIAAFALGFEMFVAIMTVHAANGFFMNWFGNQKGEGYEYHLLVIGLALALIVQGAGRFSVDHAIANRTGAEPAAA
jgi:putative oxidoreductase